MKITNKSVLAPKGFKAAGVRAGIKKGKTNLDMAIIISEKEAICAGTFTKNRVKAAPVLWDKEVVTSSPFVKAVVANSGVANACTGDEGFENTKKTAAAVAEKIGVSAENVLVASTGVIGAQLPMDVILKGADMLCSSAARTDADEENASRAIMTTDTKPKTCSCEIEISGKVVTIGAMCKGSGMIHPNMGTMLSFITTDALISKEMLQKALSKDVEDTYNMVSVDGDTSTNDTVLIMANGLAENAVIDKEGEDFDKFCEALHYINETLAKKIAEDGEGATRLFEVIVNGACDKENARILSKSVICSSLTKAAIFGKDANWGRILCALGYSGGEFVPEKTDVTIKSSEGEVTLVKGGMAAPYSEEVATRVLSAPAVTAVIDLHDGECGATAWGCDLTFDYVTINADYRS